MQIKTEVNNIHWPYYLAFERDVENLARYINFEKSNFCTHSIELARILLAASSEVDVLLKEICRLIDPRKIPENIDQYRKLIDENNQRFFKIGVESRRYSLHLKPWSSWAGNENPEWWWAYNKVKHDRSNFFQLANLQNTLNAVAALLVVNIVYALQLNRAENRNYPFELKHAISNLYPVSELFRIDVPFAYHVE